MSRKTYKFRVYPTPAQETLLCETLETCRGLYNSLLHQRKHDYERFGKSPSCSLQQKQLPLWKRTHPELGQVNAQVLQNVAKRVELAFDAFFRRVQAGEKPGYPRFKGRGHYDSITYPQVGAHGGAQITNDGVLTLSKIGTVKVVLHRAIEGTIKTCTIRRQNEKWFVSFSCIVEDEALPESTETVGIDVGLKTFAALSNGEFIDNPRFFRQEEKALAKAQRKFDKLKNQRRSKAHRKAKKVVARIHERIRNRRHNFVHQTARRLVNRFGLISIEKLTVENMMGTPAPKPDPGNPGAFLPNGAAAKSGLNKSIADASWSMFRAVLTSKAESAARVVIAVDPAYTTQDCSNCGNRQAMPLEVRVYVCPMCEMVLDRDTNAARNTEQKAVGQHSLAAKVAEKPSPSGQGVVTSPLQSNASSGSVQVDNVSTVDA